MSGGRPSDYTEERAADICALLGEGNSLKDICELENMPTRSTVYLWLAKHKEFSDMYARAREEQADTFADEIVSIADTATNETANAVRVRVDARKWVASKLKARTYGDKQQMEHSGPGGGPVVTRVELVAASDDSKNRTPS